MRHILQGVKWQFYEHATEPPSLQSQRIFVKSPEALFGAFAFLFTDQVRERFVVFWLNSANRVMGYEVVTEGTLNSTLAHPREIFRTAIVAAAASIILAHNHPSGNAEPSSEDIALTRQMVESGKLIGIPVMDHLIFAEKTYTSMAERGLI